MIQRLIAQNYVTLNIDLKCIVVIQYQNLSKIVATGPIHVQKGTLTAFFAFLVTVKQGVSLFINKKYVTVGLFIQQEGHMHVHVLWQKSSTRKLHRDTAVALNAQMVQGLLLISERGLKGSV